MFIIKREKTTKIMHFDPLSVSDVFFWKLHEKYKKEDSISTRYFFLLGPSKEKLIIWNNKTNKENERIPLLDSEINATTKNIF